MTICLRKNTKFYIYTQEEKNICLAIISFIPYLQRPTNCVFSSSSLFTVKTDSKLFFWQQKHIKEKLKNFTIYRQVYKRKSPTHKNPVCALATPSLWRVFIGVCKGIMLDCMFMRKVKCSLMATNHTNTHNFWVLRWWAMVLNQSVATWAEPNSQANLKESMQVDKDKWFQNGSV